MTPTEAQDLLKNKDRFWKLVEAFAQGRVIEYHDQSLNKEWKRVNEIDTDALTLHPERYRIKPETREFWIILFNDCFIGDMCSSRTLADGFLKSCTSPEKRKIIHVREVPS